MPARLFLHSALSACHPSPCPHASPCTPCHPLLTNLGLSLQKGTGKPQKVAILDAGAQYGKLIDRRVRELSVVRHSPDRYTPGVCPAQKIAPFRR